jgi:3-hydroxyisobutyrate dehydrogenase
MTTRIAFIGLGNMGGPMAANLVTAGYEVAGFDFVAAALEHARAHGVSPAGSGADAVQGADVVITMLPAGKHVLDAYRDELISAAGPDTLFIDSSTIDVADARTARDVVVAAGHRAIDAPVSGGVTGAEAGTLTFMVGATAEDFAAAEPILTIMGGRVVHCGDSGAGQAAKVCNNMILGISMIAVSEAFVLGEKLGLTGAV